MESESMTKSNLKGLNSISSSTLMLKGKYCVERSRKLGQGSYGTVYSGWLEHQGRRVDIAIKQIPLRQAETNAEFEVFCRSLENQLRTYLALRHHKHIAQLYDCVREGNSLYLVMEYCQHNFQEFWSRHAVRDGTHCLFFLRQMLKGYDFLRKSGFLHNDLHPRNFLVKDGAVLKLCDFGLVERIGEQQPLQNLNRNCQTLAPEVRFRCEGYSEKSEVWSLGATLYWMLTGDFPFSSDTSQQNYRDEPCGIMAIEPSSLQKLVRGCLQQRLELRIAFDELLKQSCLQEDYDTNTESSNNITLSPLYAQIDVQALLPRSRSETVLKEMYYSQQVPVVSGELVMDELREQLQWQLEVHRTKELFLKAMAAQVRRYSVLANKHKYPRQEAEFSCYKRLTLQAISTYLLADQGSIVRLQFMDAAKRTKSFSQNSQQPLLQQLTVAHQKRVGFHLLDEFEEQELRSRYPVLTKKHEQVFFSQSMSLSCFTNSFHRLVHDFLLLIVRNRHLIDRAELHLAHHLLLLSSSQTLFAALTDQHSCLELRRFADKCSTDRFEIPCHSILAILAGLT